MNSIILKNSSGFVSDQKTLGHMHATLKSKVGDQLKCTILNVGLAQGEITHISKDECQLKLSDITPASSPWFNLIVGLSRPQTCKKVLEHATTFGAARIHFFKAALSEKSYLDSKIFENNEHVDYMLAGLSQSAIYASLPEFTLDKNNPATHYKNHAPASKFILDLQGSKSFAQYQACGKIDFTQPISLAIGPERGLTASDITPFHSAGFQSVKISASILRVEHAIYSAVSQLEMLRGKY